MTIDLDEKLYVFEVRKAAKEDTAAVEKITKEAFFKYCELADLDYSIEALEESGADIARDIENKEVYVAFIDDIPVGSVRIEVLDGKRAYLSRFGVRMDYQNSGIGKILMRAVDKAMKKNGVKRLELHTGAKVTDLVRFYYSRGFYIADVDYDRGYPRALLVKEYE